MSMSSKMVTQANVTLPLRHSPGNDSKSFNGRYEQWNNSVSLFTSYWVKRRMWTIEYELLIGNVLAKLPSIFRCVKERADEIMFQLSSFLINTKQTKTSAIILSQWCVHGRRAGKKKKTKNRKCPSYYMYYVTLFKQRLLFALLHDFTFHCCWDAVRAILFILFSFIRWHFPLLLVHFMWKVDRRLEHEQHWKPVARLANVLAAFYNRLNLNF